MKSPAGATAIAVSVCPRCGTINKSGKNSCCGRGGSWFGNCGSAGNAKLRHTWHEGIRACKSRTLSKTGIAPQKGIDSSHGVDIINYKSVIAATETLAFTPANTSTPISESTTSIVMSTYTSDNVSITTSTHTLMVNGPTNILMTSSNHTSVRKSITSQGCEILLKMIVYINLLFYHIFLGRLC